MRKEQAGSGVTLVGGGGGDGTNIFRGQLGHTILQAFVSLELHSWDCLETIGPFSPTNMTLITDDAQAENIRSRHSLLYFFKLIMAYKIVIILLLNRRHANTFSCCCCLCCCWPSCLRENI